MTVLSDSKSQQGLQKITSWLRECFTEHVDCAYQPAQLPKRVIDVGCLNNKDVSIYQTRQEIGTYIALSHCWGPLELQPLRTLKSNVEELSKAIPWNHLSKTFQEAIWLTQSLGIRYLWIDSLCIMQDDLQDWREQSAVMGEVYGNSYLAVAATRAANGSEGLFHPPIEQYEISPGILMREQYSHLMFSNNASHKDISLETGQEHNPLLFRGWCFQERLLSPRFLHFSTQGMVFECNTKLSCECGTKVRSQAEGSLKSDFFSKYNYNWTRIVRNYCSSDLTRSTDLLVALSGVAKAYANRNRKTYLGGIWLEDLPRDLLWHSTKPLESCRTPIYTAPSFSWASRVGPIDYDRHKSLEDFVVLGGKCTASSVNPYGIVYDVQLRVRGVLLPCSMKRMPLSKANYNVRVKIHTHGIIVRSLARTFKKQFAIIWDKDFAKAMFHIRRLSSSESFFLDAKDDLPPLGQSRQVYCVFITENDGIILAQNQDGTYHRLGLAGFKYRCASFDWSSLISRTEFTIV